MSFSKRRMLFESRETTAADVYDLCRGKTGAALEEYTENPSCPCPHCGCIATRFLAQKQTRSIDEGATSFFKCRDCKKVTASYS